jgi:two-component system, OmpR family, phosphate regulon sensor histidine kinase PhoR
VKNSTIRLVVILATLCIVGITIIQVYWIRKAFNIKEDEFDRTVTAALYNVAQQVYDINKTAPGSNPVRQLSTNYYVVEVNHQLNFSLLEFLLRTEFEKRNIIIDFEYGIYDCSSKCMLYGNYVPLQTSKSKLTSRTLPEWGNQGYYFGVQFPNREGHLINQMGIWSFSSIVLLLVIIFFAYTLFVILKQKRLSEIQKDFINNMTHEFKTPISTIAVSTEVLKNPDIIHQPERLLNYTTIIEKENMRLKQQVERVLQMARLDKDDLGMKRESGNIHQLIEDAVRNSWMAVTEKKGRIEVSLDATHAEASVDKLHLTNVFNNLLDNAIKYCKESPLIKVKTKNSRKGIIIDIIDNGIGISPEHQRRVFQKFFRVPTGNIHDVKGFGLGLSYAKTIVTAHGGEISVKSEIGEGSSFSIFIPLD